MLILYRRPPNLILHIYLNWMILFHIRRVPLDRKIFISRLMRQIYFILQLVFSWSLDKIFWTKGVFHILVIGLGQLIRAFLFLSILPLFILFLNALERIHWSVLFGPFSWWFRCWCLLFMALLVWFGRSGLSYRIDCPIIDSSFSLYPLVVVLVKGLWLVVGDSRGFIKRSDILALGDFIMIKISVLLVEYFILIATMWV